MSSRAEDDLFGSEFLEIIVAWVGANLDPNDVFDRRKLVNWAIDNGFREE